MKKFLGLIIFISMLFSCGEESESNKEKGGKSTNPKSTKKTEGVIDGKSISQYTGKPGQLVIISKNTVLTDEVISLIDTVFGKQIKPYYPLEKKFEIYTRSPQEFEEGSKKLRNLMLLEIDSSIPKGDPKLLLKKNYYAKTQLLAEFRANNMNDLYALLELKLPELFEIYDKQEWKREYLRHKKDNNTTAKKLLRKQFGIELDIPAEARFERKDNQYAHLLFPDRSRQMDMKAGGGYNSSKANFIQSGIMIWQYNYKDSSQLMPDYLMRARDTILKHYAKHEIEGVYMGTQDHPAVLPVHERLKIGDVVGYQFRGLYKFTGRMEPSGGKFWSFHFLHPKRNKIVAISGYLDAPPTMSQSYDLRRIQAVLYSLKLVE
ncbi:MAG: DUF4837 family protein [Brumimicrobium sp.]